MIVVDTLLLDELERQIARGQAGHNINLIVHYLPSLDPDIDDDERERQIHRETAIFNHLSGFLVPSSFVETVLRTRYRARQPIYVVPPALCVEPLEPAVRPNDFRGLMVANLIPAKGVHEFVEGLSHILTVQDKLEMIIAGRSDIEPDYAAACCRIVNKNPVLARRVCITGPLTPEQLRRVYSESTVLVSASKMETFGMALSEARTFGLPIITLNAGNAAEHVVHGENGLLLESIPEVVEECLRLSRNPLLLADFAERATAFKPHSRYTWEDAARSLIEQLTANPVTAQSLS